MATHVTKTEIAVQEVRERIRSGAIRRGERLVVGDLTSILDMSPTPIREALRLLQADGLVEYRPHHGIVVAEVSYALTEETYKLRASLEPMAAEMAVEKMTPARVKELERLHEALTNAVHGRTTTISNYNRQWHTVLYEGSESPILLDFIRRLWEAFPWRTAWAMPGRAEETAEEHNAIMEAMRAGDGPLTSERLKDHILKGRGALLAQMRFDSLASERDSPTPTP